MWWYDGLDMPPDEHKPKYLSPRCCFGVVHLLLSWSDRSCPRGSTVLRMILLSALFCGFVTYGGLHTPFPLLPMAFPTLPHRRK